MALNLSESFSTSFSNTMTLRQVLGIIIGNPDLPHKIRLEASPLDHLFISFSFYKTLIQKKQDFKIVHHPAETSHLYCR